MAEQLGVSIMPVREHSDSSRRNDSLSSPPAGAVVAALSIDDIEETYAIRVALEGLAARHAAELLSAADLADIEGLFEVMARATEANDLQAFIAADRAFHVRPCSLRS